MIQELCTSTVTSVRNGIYVLRRDGCCNHISNVGSVGEGDEIKSLGVSLLIAVEAFAQEA